MGRDLIIPKKTMEMDNIDNDIIKITSIYEIRKSDVQKDIDRINAIIDDKKNKVDLKFTSRKQRIQNRLDELNTAEVNSRK